MVKAMIFCRTRLDCDNLMSFLNSKGHSSTCLYGGKDTKERAMSIQKFKEGKAKFLISTDGSARTIDLKGIPYVINMTLPPSEDSNLYVERVQRSGTVERMGLDVSLVSSVAEKVWFHKCSNYAECNRTQLLEDGGCAMWYNESKCLKDIEELIGEGINRIGSDMFVQAEECDGQTFYVAKSYAGGAIPSHAVQLKGAVEQLNDLERTVQLSYLRSIT